ncbi:diphosphomevalonate decarboxylase [Rhizopus microsporus var. microsporus]|uniref:Diphosphomevalonate decarboxylase n=2 Tax=Rhizopus microsporus TaxID=58291 RepID=A0A2G4SKB6_RHIZD|nr:putative diphosphomevalonate decarboxylase [Rhizopus microsporus ATCC 52813]ORE02104.1 diphosphomevalonate decarboxylase [Rhizopus microsporus var. microsporus]PHZ09210.1 putative diphosphomevalonate decarboxylase [Rhizopus microsporus ATCC 52813]
MKTVTCTAPVNIAVIKYWGKRDTELILPTNSSLSVTLSQDILHSKTTISAAKEYTQDRLWLNGKEEDITKNKRMHNCFRETRAIRKAMEDKAASEGKPIEPLSTYHLHVCSENNFPTAAGLASSASGLAALVFTLAQLFELTISTSEVSRIARQGSGSACRSLFGGFVAWEMGQKEDGSDSVAVQVAPESHWPELEALICVVSDAKKGTSSTAGMQSTIKTSTLMNERINQIVPARMEAMKKAILERDFQTFAELTMRDSNQFHAVCLDTYPPIFYMNDTSRAIIQLIHEYNASSPDGKLKAAYTYDAGPNAVIYASKEHMPEIIQLIGHYFPSNKELSEFFADPYNVAQGTKLGQDFIPKTHTNFNEKVIPVQPAGSVSRLLHTKVHDGPRVLSEADSLLNAEGLPKRLA